jgi:hypothetical protein
MQGEFGLSALVEGAYTAQVWASDPSGATHPSRRALWTEVSTHLARQLEDWPREADMANETLISEMERNRVTKESRSNMATMTETISLEQELNPWLAQEVRFDFAAKKLGLDDGI